MSSYYILPPSPASQLRSGVAEQALLPPLPPHCGARLLLYREKKSSAFSSLVDSRRIGAVCWLIFGRKKNIPGIPLRDSSSRNRPLVVTRLSHQSTGAAGLNIHCCSVALLPSPTQQPAAASRLQLEKNAPIILRYVRSESRRLSGKCPFWCSKSHGLSRKSSFCSFWC